MTSRDFCFWLQGFFELTTPTVQLTAPQIALVRAHLNLVFAHEIDPSMGGPRPQAKLNSIHGDDLVARC
jgi:hypothetical protein